MRTGTWNAKIPCTEISGNRRKQQCQYHGDTMVKIRSTKASVGKKFTIPMATAIPPVYTPKKFQNPDQMTAILGLSVLV